MRRIRILHVEDAPDDQELIKHKLLGLQGDIEIAAAGSGSEALRMLKRNRYDCILSAYMMPGMDGLELVKAIRDAGDGTPFIILTGRGNENVAAEAFRAGADDYFTKELESGQSELLLDRIKRLAKEHEIRGGRRRLGEAEVGDQELLLSILDGNPIANFVIDKHHSVISWNRACENLTGYSREVMLGRRVYSRSFYPEQPTGRPVLADLVLDGDLEGIEKYYGALGVRQSALIEEAWEVTAPLSLDTGLKYIYFLAAPLYDSSSKVIGAVETLQDVSEKVQAEVERRESEDKCRLIIENAHEGITVVQDGRIKFINPKAVMLSGYPLEDLLSMPFEQLIHVDDRKQAAERYSRRVNGAKLPEAIEVRFVDKAGRTLWIITHAVPVNWEGRPAVLYFLSDITEQVRATEEAKSHQEQLIHTAKMVSLGTLVSGVAHEINNPNHVVMSNASVLSEALRDIGPLLERHYKEFGDFVVGGIKYSLMREQLPAMVAGILKASERIRLIVEELRNFARKQPASMTDMVDINEVVKSAVTLVSNMIKKSTDHFSAEYARVSPLFKGNFQRLEQVVINLLTNACQALDRKERGIYVSTRFDKKRNSILVRVRNEGEGIPDENLAHILDPFFTTRREKGGTGLGLSICATIVEEHGGRLEIESRRGRDTTVTVTIPAENPADTADKEG